MSTTNKEVAVFYISVDFYVLTQEQLSLANMTTKRYVLLNFSAFRHF